jgi:hypothetical protein
LGSGIRKNSEAGGSGCQTYGIQMSYDIRYQPPTLIFQLNKALAMFFCYARIYQIAPEASVSRLGSMSFSSVTPNPTGFDGSTDLRASMNSV